MALAKATRRKPQMGHNKPRLAPPVPARTLAHDADGLVQRATDLGRPFIPWQAEAARYIDAGTKEHWLYPEVAVVVARQNGKTELLVPHVIRRLLRGRKIMHTAQNRELPREVFGRVADIIASQYGDLLKSRPRFANGQEEIRLRNGGIYRIVAPSRGGARGPSNDDLLIDELREMVTHDFIAAAKPTLMASPNPQTLYLSNAGEDDSVVLNALRARADSDPSLAYLEWSAAPERDAADVEGWYESNPASGHLPGVFENLEREYRTNKLAGTLAIFETEHLCRWVSSMRERLVGAAEWNLCEAPDVEVGSRPSMGISLDPDGKRASVALAWQMDDGIGLTMLYNVTGDPIDTSVLGADIRKTASSVGAARIGFDPLTDGELAKYLRKPEKVGGQSYSQATAQFVNLVNARRLHWHDADAVGDDLTWTARKDGDEGRFEAVRSNDDRPITASLAAIRAVWLASGPKPAVARIY